ncbi:MAG: hypothetical protein RL375_4483 [Pseudomonadota bacterium]|jgi:enamine deaminase RidA (YjgF/YER057c/UK114 family)
MALVPGSLQASMPVPRPPADALLPIRWIGVHEDGAAVPGRIEPAGPLIDTAWHERASDRGEQVDPAFVLRWACDGDWLQARITVDEAATPEGLLGAARTAYTQLFALMARHGLTRPARFWNYLADINVETDSPAGRLERYRQFNIGRQQAFVAAGQAAFDGAPAACALGTDGGRLSVALLASRIAPRPIENPRQLSAYRYPQEHGPVSPSFSRAAELRLPGGRRLLFISGTASIVGHASVHPGDVAEQTRESLRNIDVLLAQVDGTSETLRQRLDLTIYLRDAAHLPLVQALIASWLQHDADALARTIWLRADVCRAELLVEIEAQTELAPLSNVTLPNVTLSDAPADRPHGASA